jgi:hypothetical protein
MVKHVPSTIHASVEKWSEGSQRKLAYVGAPTAYDDIHFKCYHCGHPTVFSADAQRETYEVKKAYIRQRRTLCQDCFVVRVAFEREVMNLSRRWKTERRAAEQSPEFLERWLHLLNELPRYGARRNTAHLAMLQRLVGNAV